MSDVALSHSSDIVDAINQRFERKLYEKRNPSNNLYYNPTNNQPLNPDGRLGYKYSTGGSFLSSLGSLTGVGAASLFIGDLITSFGKQAYYDKFPWLDPNSGYSSKEDYMTQTGQGQKENGAPSVPDSSGSGDGQSYTPPSSGDTLLSVLKASGFDTRQALIAIADQTYHSAEANMLQAGLLDQLVSQIGVIHYMMSESLLQQQNANEYMDIFIQNHTLKADELKEVIQANNDALQDHLQQHTEVVNALVNKDFEFTYERSADEVELTALEIEKHQYSKTPVWIRDLDGNLVAEMSPRDAAAVKNISQARKDTDTNNFEMEDEDFDLIQPPSLDQIYVPESKTARILELNDEINNQSS